ncbi:MAG: SO_0444 family Cu/Zn efflux transporter [Bacteroidales bacterium]|nr:SO_0444 family Cu/Zn efflux transporter [Bacteroidales bacterium]
MREVLNLINEMSPYLLLGFGFAGLLHAFVPAQVYHRYLSKGDFRSVLWAAMIGVPLPLCSCGVIPTAMSLRKEGASKGATTSFLIATPQTGVDSILATASLLGIPFAIIRPIAALVTALFGGQLVNIATRNEKNEASESTSKASEERPKGFWNKLKEAIEYGYFEMMQDIGKWLMIGLVVAGLITVFVPDDFFLYFNDKPLLTMLMVLAVSVPMYVCATGSIPIAAALMLKGISPGAALVLLMAGPACNMASIMVIRKVLEKKTMWVYLFSIILGAITFGLIIDLVLPTEWFTSSIKATKECCHEAPAIFNVICSVVLGILLIFALIMRHHHHCDCGCDDHDDHCECESHSHENHKVMEKKQFKVDGMMCNHCRANVEKNLKALEGVNNVEVDLASGTAVVEGDVSDEEVIRTIEGLGYKAKRI